MKLFFPILIGVSLAVVAGCHKSSDSAGGGGSNGARKLTLALMPKSKGNAYFISCRKGADKAARELGVELLFDGPTDPDPAKQNEIVENWIALGVDVIAAACENKEGISTALRKARQKGVRVLTYDSDAASDAREFFVNQATPEGIGNALMDEAARLCGKQGEFAIITASLTAANMNEWQKHIEARRSSKYPDMKMVALRPCDDLKDKAQAEATALLGANPDLKLIMAICSPAVPGAAEAVKQAGKTGKVKVIGLGLPSENRRYVKEGVTDSVILWRTEDLGYLTVQAAVALAKGELKQGAATFKAGGLGEFQIQGDNILLGNPFIFNKENIDQFDF
jgi:rhamnose transport system substrate-binding protein